MWNCCAHFSDALEWARNSIMCCAFGVAFNRLKESVCMNVERRSNWIHHQCHVKCLSIILWAISSYIHEFMISNLMSAFIENAFDILHFVRIAIMWYAAKGREPERTANGWSANNSMSLRFGFKSVGQSIVATITTNRMRKSVSPQKGIILFSV